MVTTRTKSYSASIREQPDNGTYIDVYPNYELRIKYQLKCKVLECEDDFMPDLPSCYNKYSFSPLANIYTKQFEVTMPLVNDFKQKHMDLQNNTITDKDMLEKFYGKPSYNGPKCENKSCKCVYSYEIVGATVVKKHNPATAEMPIDF